MTVPWYWQRSPGRATYSTLATYINFGSIIGSAAPGGDWVNAIMALGVDQAGMNINIQFGVGTSFQVAVPYVAGVGALMVDLVDINGTIYEKQHWEFN